MSDGADALAEIRDGMQHLQQEFDDLKAARTPAEKAEAKQDVREAEADLRKLAAEHGISQERMAEAIRAARDAEDEERYGAMIDRRIDAKLKSAAETADGDDDEDDGGEEAGGKPKTGKGNSGAEHDPKQEEPAGTGKPPAPPPPTERPPDNRHWSDKSIGELIS
jgi:hypothetical protein